MIYQASWVVEISTDYLCKVAYMESNFNPNAKAPKGTSRGLFQVNKQTEKSIRKNYDIKGDIFNPYINSLIAGYLTKENIEYYKNKKIELNNINLYYAHFLGVYKAKIFINSDNNIKIKNLFPKEYEYNTSFFRDRTVGEIKNILKKRYNNATGCL